MKAEELWKKAGIDAEYEAWAFGDAPDKLAELVRSGIKTATCSALCLYELENEPLPQVGEYSVILDSNKNAVCIIKTTRVCIITFDKVGAEHAFKEGEGDRSIEYWRSVHREFFTNELAAIGREFDEKLELVLEEFELVTIKE